MAKYTKFQCHNFLEIETKQFKNGKSFLCSSHHRKLSLKDAAAYFTMRWRGYSAKVSFVYFCQKKNFFHVGPSENTAVFKFCRTQSYQPSIEERKSWFAALSELDSILNCDAVVEWHHDFCGILKSTRYRVTQIKISLFKLL